MRMQSDEPPLPPEIPKETPAEEISQDAKQSITADRNSPVPPVRSPKSHKKRWIGVAVVVALIAGGLIWWHFGNRPAQPAASSQKTTAAQTQTSTGTTKVQGLQLDTSKNYGNKYANGILPVGDGKYTTSAPKQGYVYACSQYAQNLETSNGGAMTRGPWFTDNNTEYNVNEKLHVEGSVMWSADYSMKLEDGQRVIVTNDLPSHPTGIFPIMSSDPAYQYDHNPNAIAGQTFTFNLAASPSYNATPNCESGEVGVMTTGVALFNALDAGGRDAGAWEVQDSCDGHPQSDGIYHYHTLSSCIKDISVHTVIGYALDGFPITGPEVGPNDMLTTDDLDECHGIVSQITLDGKSVTMYHYVMTQDFPYSVSCFRGTPITPPGQNEGQSQGSSSPQGQNQAPGQAPPRR